MINYRREKEVKMKVTLRKATKDDVKILVDMDKMAFSEITWWTPMTKSQFSELIEKNLVYVAESNGFMDHKGVIGYINGKKEKNTIYLDNVYVKKDFRNQGVARKLMNKFLSKYKKVDVILHCPERLCGFYQKFGFYTKYVEMKRKRGW
jgi:ribosomal protein S18 acetylase RimI-like enzyme